MRKSQLPEWWPDMARMKPYTRLIDHLVHLTLTTALVVVILDIFIWRA